MMTRGHPFILKMCIPLLYLPLEYVLKSYKLSACYFLYLFAFCFKKIWNENSKQRWGWMGVFSASKTDEKHYLQREKHIIKTILKGSSQSHNNLMYGHESVHNTWCRFKAPRFRLFEYIIPFLHVNSLTRLQYVGDRPSSDGKNWTRRIPLWAELRGKPPRNNPKTPRRKLVT